MKECREQMIADGATAIPRTCPICMLGPCQRGFLKGQTAKAITAVWLVENKSGKRVITFSEERAEFLAELMDGTHDKVPCDDIHARAGKL